MIRTLFAAIMMMALTNVGAALAQDKPSESHVKAAREMLAATRADQMYSKVPAIILKQQLGIIKQAKPDLPAEVEKRFQTIFLVETGKSLDDLLNKVAEAYALLMSEDEINQIVKFYKSPVGTKLIRAKPMMVQESLKIGRAWGENIGVLLGEETIRQLKAEGHKF